MRWVVVTIVVFLVPYTYLNIKYRKPGPAFEPYADFTARAEAERLAKAGYTRVTASLERPFPAPAAGSLFAGAAAPVVATAVGGLPTELGELLSAPPSLVAGASALYAPAEVPAGHSFRLSVSLRHDDGAARPVGADVYLRAGGGVVVVPSVEPIPEGLQVRRPEELVVLTVPAGAIPPGSHEVVLITRETSLVWTLLVR